MTRDGRAEYIDDLQEALVVTINATKAMFGTGAGTSAEWGRSVEMGNMLSHAIVALSINPYKED